MTACTTGLPWADPTRPIDTAALLHALREGLPACRRGELHVASLRVLQAQRSPSRQRHPHPVRLELQAEVQDLRDGRRGRQGWMAKAYRDGAAASAAPAARAAATAVPDFGDALSHLPVLDLLVWAWPNDPALPQLPDLVQPARVKAHLPEGVTSPSSSALAGQGSDQGSGVGPRRVPAMAPGSWAHRPSGHPDAGAGPVLHVERLRYRPEQRATLRYTLGEHGAGPRRTVVAKTFADDRAAVLDARFRHFWHAARHDPWAPAVAEPLGVDAATRTLWQAEARGQPLVQAWRRGDGAAGLAAVGRALARLHATDPSVLQLPDAATRGLSHWLAELPLRHKKIARAAPELAGRAAAVVDALARAAARLPARARMPMHGDFHPEQVWLDGPRAVFFDFDEFTLGDPMEDLAQFIVKLEQLPLPPSTLRAGIEALCRGYADAGGTLCGAQLAWYRSLQALLQTTRAFVFQAPGWRDTLPARLARTEALLQEIPT